jgi:hypothetical protein
VNHSRTCESRTAEDARSLDATSGLPRRDGQLEKGEGPTQWVVQSSAMRTASCIMRWWGCWSGIWGGILGTRNLVGSGLPAIPACAVWASLRSSSALLLAR